MSGFHLAYFVMGDIYARPVRGPGLMFALAVGWVIGLAVQAMPSTQLQEGK
jgi:hypothetical protein